MEKEHNHNDHQGGSFHPFLLGVIVGVALALLFTTKKGRKILKALTDQGMDKIEKWEEVLYKKIPATEAVEGVDEMLEAQDYEAAEELKEDLSPKHVSEHAVKQALKTEHTPNGKTSPGGVRRFFKGAKKS
jgi:gas vesicle protein